MIDSIKITLPHFVGSLYKCDLYCTFPNGTRSYRLYSKEHEDEDEDEKRNDAYLTVNFNETTKTLRIEGSLRKWYLGVTSLIDLNSTTFKKVILKLSKLLEISSDEICKGIVTQCEIGLNIKVRIPCEKIIPKIAKYSNLKRYEYEGETVGFKGSNKELKLYHKTRELVAKNPFKVTKSKRKAFAKLEEKGNFFLRIEFTLFDKQSFIQHDLNYIRTLGDVAIYYSVLYEFWTSQFDKIIMSNIIIFEDNMTPKEFLISLGIDHLGLNEFIVEYQKRFKSKSSNGLKKAKSHASKEVFNIFNKYESRQEYNKNKLRTDIARVLTRIKRKDDSIDLPTLLRNLWGNVNNTQTNNVNEAINIE